MKRRWKIALAALAAVVLVFIILLPSGTYRRELEAYKQDLRAKGEKTTFAELFSPRSTTNMSPGATLFMAVTNLVRWTNMPVRFATGQTNLTLQQRADYNSNVQTLVLLRSALAAGPLDFNLDYNLGYELPLPQVGRFKQATQFAAGTAAQALSLKDYQEAWADLLVTVDLVRMQGGEPIMISDLVRVADFNIAVPVVIDALEERVWTEAQLAELQAKWEGMDLFINAEPTLTMEFAMTADIMQQVRTDFKKLWEFSSAYQSGSSAIFNPPQGRISREVYALVQRVKTHGWRNTWSYDEELRQLQVIMATKETAGKVTKSGAFVPAFNELSASYSNINNSHSNASSHFLLYTSGGDTMFSRYLSRLADAEVQRRLAVTAIALERFKLAKGIYPARLEELMPEYLKSVPMDLMDGKPLRYRLRADGDYLLYSVGSGGKDDGGTGDDNIWPRPSANTKQ